MRGDPGIAGDTGPPGPRGPQGEKGEKGDQGKSISSPRVIEAPVEKTVNEGQTAVLKCLADGYPHPSVSWSRKNSSLPVGRHVMRPSSTLIIKNVKPEDAGIYSCSAQNVLGIANASVQLNVQCEFHEFHLSIVCHLTLKNNLLLWFFDICFLYSNYFLGFYNFSRLKH